MPHPPRTIAQAIEQENIAYQKCTVSGCKGYRYVLSSHCRVHRQRRRRHGDALIVHAIRAGHYKAERREVAQFIKRHLKLQHPGLLAGLSFLESFLHSQPEDHEDKFAYHLARLRRHSVEPLTILVEVCALWLFLQRRPWDDREQRLG